MSRYLYIFSGLLFASLAISLIWHLSQIPFEFEINAIVLPSFSLLVLAMVNRSRSNRWRLLPVLLLVYLVLDICGLLLFNMTNLYILEGWTVYTLTFEIASLSFFVVLQQIILRLAKKK